MVVSYRIRLCKLAARSALRGRQGSFNPTNLIVPHRIRRPVETAVSGYRRSARRVRGKAGRDPRQTGRFPPHRTQSRRAALRRTMFLHRGDSVESPRVRLGGRRPPDDPAPMVRWARRDCDVLALSDPIPQSQSRLHRPGEGAILSAGPRGTRQDAGFVPVLEGRSRVARPRSPRFRVERGQPFPAEHGPRGGPRHLGPTYPPESDSSRRPASATSDLDSEAILGHREANRELLGGDRDSDGGARPTFLEPRDGRDLQVTRVRTTRAERYRGRSS